MNQGAAMVVPMVMAHYRTLRASTGSEEYLSVLFVISMVRSDVVFYKGAYDRLVI